MRPKIVILILLVAIGLLALAAVMNRRKPTAEPPPPEVTELPPPAPMATTKVQPNLADTNAMAITEQLREAEMAKQLDEVRELQAEGWASPTTTSLLLSKITNQEPEVRKAAVEALVQLHATDAVPGLEQALAHLENPRDKVTVMDAIDYLKLPTDSPGPAGVKDGPDDGKGATMPAKPKKDSTTPNPRIQPGSRKSSQRNAIPPGAPAVQPVSPVPDAPVAQ
jgi:hypothetical protein